MHGFSTIYEAFRLDENINYWDNEKQTWYRPYREDYVVLKSLNNSSNINDMK